KDCGVIGFVTGSGYIEKLAMDGLRKNLREEFSSIYVLNLRGDIRKNMLSKGRAQEGQNVFGSGSMTGIAVALFIKNPDAIESCKIYYHDIGDNLTTKEKLREIQRLGGVGGIKREYGWQMITPDAHGDWLDQRNSDFEKFLALGDKKGSDKKLFENFSCGVKTSRDAWAYNSSHEDLLKNMSDMVAFYNSEVEHFNVMHLHSD
uniref:type ISP restriction/modification enzyme n=1 Tax=Bartonella raoultii TaxID=1457020 RepID=UPI00280BC41D